MRFLIAAFLATAALAPLSAQTRVPAAPQDDSSKKAELGTLESIPEKLRSEALELTILAVVKRAVGEEPWKTSDVKYTLNGMPVTVKMVGSSVIVYVTITPYPSSERDLKLVAQGQVWFSDKGEMRYHTTVDTLTVAFGERVFFYPLGMNADGDAPLRIEIVLKNYAASRADGTGTEKTGQ
ncbi:MAG TPA: hypothetical protein DCG47_14895 [Spirochaetaceae bacterium]|nr:hypothetical protein [Spirochaetaceae bacterium]